MKKIVLLSGKLELSGSTTWLIALHEAIGELGADVVHIVIGKSPRFHRDGAGFSTQGRW